MARGPIITADQRQQMCAMFEAGKSMTEIASNMGVNPNTVSKHLADERKRLAFLTNGETQIVRDVKINLEIEVSIKVIKVIQ